MPAYPRVSYQTKSPKVKFNSSTAFPVVVKGASYQTKYTTTFDDNGFPVNPS